MEQSLIPHDKEVLADEIQRTKKVMIVFFIVFDALVLTTIASYLLQWRGPTTILLGMAAFLFLVGVVVTVFQYSNRVRDLQYGFKTTIKGRIEEKRIGKGRATFHFQEDYLRDLAEYISNEKKGISKNYGAMGVALARDSQNAFCFVIQGEIHVVGIHNYMAFQKGEHVVMDVAPRSRVVLSVQKSNP